VTERETEKERIEDGKAGHTKQTGVDVEDTMIGAAVVDEAQHIPAGICSLAHRPTTLAQREKERHV
jgi:hypothetical protein